MNFAELELIPRVRWSDTEADPRVSHAEQEDQMPPVGAPETWHVVLLCLSPLIPICVPTLVYLFSR